MPFRPSGLAHTTDDGGRNRYCHLALKFVWVEAIQFKQLSMASENIEVVDEVNSFYTAGSL